MPGVRDVVPAYGSFAVHFDPLRTDVPLLREVVARAAAAAPPRDRTGTHRVQSRSPSATAADSGRISAPWRRGQAWTPIMSSPLMLPGSTGCSCSGFLPGFPYMASVDERIAMPRRETPRTRVAAGSVGIAGPQTGVYSFDSPGGWQIIGRTPLVLFDSRNEPPALLAPGQHVRFRSLSSLRVRRHAPARAACDEPGRASGRPAHDCAGSRPLGSAVLGRARGGPDGLVVTSPRQSARSETQTPLRSSRSRSSAP